jgi:hypothetical protein
MQKKNEINHEEILEKLKWFHGEAFNYDILKDEFLDKLKGGTRGKDI